MMNFRKMNVQLLIPVLAFGILFFIPDLCLADMSSSLKGIQQQLTGVILPVLSVIGLALAAFSFFTGNPNCKTHITYAVLGCIFGFASQAIVNVISSVVK